MNLEPASSKFDFDNVDWDDEALPNLEVRGKRIVRISMDTVGKYADGKVSFKGNELSVDNQRLLHELCEGFNADVLQVYRVKKIRGGHDLTFILAIEKNNEKS